MSFPNRRLRRLRKSQALRRLVAETRLSVDDLVAPLFVREGIDSPIPIPSLSGVQQHTRQSLVEEVKHLHSLGVPGVILFGIPKQKDPQGSEAWNPEGIVQLALQDCRDAIGQDMVLIADLCIDEYTDHGHCGVVGEDGSVDNDQTITIYGKIAQAQARAGADIVAPSGMMDGQVRAIRDALDADNFQEVAILAYSAKYASGLYGPFRDAVDVTIADGGDRKTYQQDWRNGREALAEIRADEEEGADMIMVKPGIIYLDIISKIKNNFKIPVLAYQVSGEYSLIKNGIKEKLINEDAIIESITAFKRAGACAIITYFALDIAKRIKSIK